MKHADHDAHRAFEESAFHGCHGVSCNQGRQPCRDRCGAEMSCAELDKLRPLVRRPAPRKPHLPLWTRVKLEWQRARARVVLSGVFLVSMLATLGATIATWLAR